MVFMDYCIHPDGSFDLFTEKQQLLSAYPSIDGKPVRPLKVEASAHSARYELIDGTLTISIQTEKDILEVHCKVEGLHDAHDISPIGSAGIVGCDRAFVQGLGMRGPSGFSLLGKNGLTSYSLIAVGDERECIVLNAREHGRLNNVYRVCDGHLSAGFETERLSVDKPELPVLYVRAGKDYSSVLGACAAEIAQTMRARPVKKPAFHWCSWYYLYHTLDQKTLEEYLEGFQKYREIAPFSHIQIDAGYFPSCGDWLERCDRFPDGLKHVADTIRAAGYEPGIWVAPFMVGDNSRLYREHPDWMLKSADGGYVRPCKAYNEPKPWGYRDSDYFVLDTSHPDAMAYLRRVFTTLREWGYTLFKTDFLFWGLQDSSSVVRHGPGKTSFEHYRDVMKMIRESIGEEARWLGCIAPFMPSIGYVDMMRIGADVGAQWKEGGFGPTNMLQELTADQYFNNIYWQNDPDAVMLRDFHIHLKSEQIEALAILEAMSGGTIYTSDPIHQIAQDRRDLLNFIRPDAIHTPEYPQWSEMREETCVVQRLRNRTLVYFFNKTDRQIIRPCNWKELVGEDVEYLFKRHGGCNRVEEVPFVTIEPRSGVLYYGTREPMEKEPGNMWLD